MSPYKIISSDSHIVEPPDLWEQRIDPEFRTRAPYVAKEADTDQWYADGNIKFGSFVNVQAGLRFNTPEKISAEGRYSEAPEGGFNPHAHVKDMDLDGIAGGVLYPSNGLTTFAIPAGDLLSAMFRAYNDWLADFCKPYPNQLKGIAMINEDDVSDAVNELERSIKLGLSGAMITVRPTWRRFNDPAYDILWATAQDLDIPISLHSGTFRWRPDGNQADQGGAIASPAELTNKDYHVRNAIGDMIFAGVFERYPRLKIGAIEFEVLWAPYFMGRMDNTYRERTVGQQIPRFKDNAMPSDIFRNNVFISFQEDDLGIQLRSAIGVDTLAWGSDYPHAESTFPRSLQIIDRILEGVPDHEKAKIVAENTARLYRFN